MVRFRLDYFAFSHKVCRELVRSNLSLSTGQFHRPVMATVPLFLPIHNLSFPVSSRGMCSTNNYISEYRFK